jgi:hypothetical protein
MRYASNYRSGQVLEVIGRDRPAGLERGTYDVVGVSAKGVVSLRDTEGKRVRFRPDRLDPMTSATIWLCLSAKPCAFTKAIAFAGPPMTRREACSIPPRPMWSPSHVNGVEVRTSEGVNMVLAHGDRMLSRLGLAYAINMHQAQGMTTDQGIGVMHSAERLSNQRLTHVMATRVRDDLTIYTNDRDALLRSIEANPGDKASALEHAGASARPSQSSAPGGLRKSPSPSSTADRADQFAIDVATLRGSAPSPRSVRSLR